MPADFGRSTCTLETRHRTREERRRAFRDFAVFQNLASDSAGSTNVIATRRAAHRSLCRGLAPFDEPFYPGCAGEYIADSANPSRRLYFCYARTPRATC